MTAFHCSFCGKSHHQVRKLIAGPSVYICDECVDLCNDIIASEPTPLDAPRSVGPLEAIGRWLDQRAARRHHDRLARREAARRQR